MKFWDNPEFVEKYKISPPDFVLRYFLEMFDTSLEGKGLVVGCKEESSIFILSHLGYKMDGIDLDGYSKDLNIPFKLLTSPVQKVSMSRNKYDFAVCLSTLQYLGLGIYKGDLKEQDSDSKSLVKITEGLKDGGILYMSIPIGEAVCPLSGRVYTPSEIVKLIPDNLSVVRKQAIYSEYFLSHGENQAIKLIKEEDAFRENKYIPEMFYVLKKGRSLDKSNDFKSRKSNKRSNYNGN